MHLILNLVTKVGVSEVPGLALPEHSDPGGDPRLHRGRCHLPQALQEAPGAEKGGKGRLTSLKPLCIFSVTDHTACRWWRRWQRCMTWAKSSIGRFLTHDLSIIWKHFTLPGWRSTAPHHNDGASLWRGRISENLRGLMSVETWIIIVRRGLVMRIVHWLCDMM